MKYAIIIPDGCADEPQEALGGKTPLQAARAPNMDRIAQAGVVGRANNVPPTLTPASDVATLSLFGYDPLVVYTGRAPLEAAALAIRLGPARGLPHRFDGAQPRRAGRTPRQPGPRRPVGTAGHADLAVGSGPGAAHPAVCGRLPQARGDHQRRRSGARRRRASGVEAHRR